MQAAGRLGFGWAAAGEDFDFVGDVAFVVFLFYNGDCLLLGRELGRTSFLRHRDHFLRLGVGEVEVVSEALELRRVRICLDKLHVDAGGVPVSAEGWIARGCC